MSRITAVCAAAPAEALRHHEARLALETDAADIGSAVAAGELDDVVLVDVRGRAAYAAGHIPGAVSLPYGEIDAAALDALGDDLLVVYCWGPGCNGAQNGAARIARLGRPVKEMLGGFEYYVREGWPVEGDLADAGLYEADERGLVSVPKVVPR
jgi:rhodanese-related sulfurtransferase